MGLHELTTRLAAAGAELAATAAALPGSDPGPAAFGADATGALGELGRELRGGYLAALDARVREAAAHAARLSAAADAIARARSGYAEADADAIARARSGYAEADADAIARARSGYAEADADAEGRHRD